MSLSNTSTQEELLKKSSLGQSVAFFRKKAGLTQKELGDKSLMSHVQISKIESGKVNPQIGSIRRLCSALGITHDELLNHFNAMNLVLKLSPQKLEQLNDLTEILKKLIKSTD